MTTLTRVLFLYFAFAGSGFSQTSSCHSLEIALGAASNGHAVRGLDATAFQVSWKKQPWAIESFGSDARPRRILIVLSGTHNISVDEKKLALAAIDNIVANARKEDSFGLLSEFTAETMVPLEAPREQVSKAIEQIGVDLKGKRPSQGAFDTLMAAAKMFREPSRDNVILFVGTEFESDNSRAKFQDVVVALQQRNVRLFALQYGLVWAGTFSAPVLFSNQSWVLFANQENLMSLALRSGGFIVEVKENPQYRVKFDPNTLKETKESLWYVYRDMTEFYTLQVKRPEGGRSKPEDLKIDVDASLRKQLPDIQLYYPRDLPECSMSTASK